MGFLLLLEFKISSFLGLIPQFLSKTLENVFSLFEKILRSRIRLAKPIFKKIFYFQSKLFVNLLKK